MSGPWATMCVAGKTIVSLGQSLLHCLSSRVSRSWRGTSRSRWQFEGFERRSFTIKELADPNWPWGYSFGVYCFLVDGEVVYVGRAAGKTIGERLWDQLRSTSDPDWKKVVTSDETVVEVFLVDNEATHMACALECYLTAKLEPKFNLRSV